jgi:predicted amidohydrolase
MKRTRRNLLKAAAGAVSWPTAGNANADKPATVALLHLDPRPGEIEANKRMIEDAVRRASSNGARVVVSPELAISGYGFRDLIGTDWIQRQQGALLAWAADLARQSSVFLILGIPEADGQLFNSMIVFAPDGARIGHHRKIMVLKVGSESWSTAGDSATVLALGDIGRIGLFVCADMYSKRLVDETAAQGVDLLVSAAAWAPGHHGPNGEWERASLATGRPVLVCNRTGHDSLDFGAAQSVAAAEGSVAFSHSSLESAIILVDWSPNAHRLSDWRVA